MRLLLIEDDKEISEFLKMSLEAEAFIVDVAYDGDRGSYFARCEEYDAIILDYMLPKKDGFQVCQELRQSGVSVPIIMISIKKETPLKVGLLNLGADDYLIKPFQFEELLARLRAILRRPSVLKPSVLSISDLTLEPAAQRVMRGRKEIYLTRKEFILLQYLLENKGRVLSRGMILEHVWSRESDPFSNTIESHILNLRKKIENGKKKLIHTVPGRGYKMDLFAS